MNRRQAEFGNSFQKSRNCVIQTGGPSVSLTLWCFVIYSARRFVVCLTLYHFVLVFSVLLALRLPRLGKRELILVIFVLLDLSVSSSP